MRRLALLALVSLCQVPNAAAADVSWAQPQIKLVVETGLLAERAADFKPRKPLTQKALAGALETLSLARLLELSGSEQEWVRSETEQLVLPQLSDVQRQVLSRAVSFVGYPDVWGGISEARQQPFGKPAPGGFDCSGFVWRVFKLEPFPGASALAVVLRGRTTYQMAGEVPPAHRIRGLRRTTRASGAAVRPRLSTWRARRRRR